MTINNEHQWGDTFSSTNKSPTAYRLIYQNVNGLSTKTATRFDKTRIFIATTRDLQPDIHMMSETNVYWGNETMRNGSEAAFTAALGKGTLSCAYNTHHTHSISPSAYPNHLTGGVCTWFGPKVSPRVTHMLNDGLGRFTASSMMGPRNTRITIITS